MAPPFTKEIRFEDVTFSYTDKEVNLDKVSFVIPAGKSVAFVGRSGSGKSTVLNLLARFYQTAEGAITLDGATLSRSRTTPFGPRLALCFRILFFSAPPFGKISGRADWRRWTRKWNLQQRPPKFTISS